MPHYSKDLRITVASTRKRLMRFYGLSLNKMQPATMPSTQERKHLCPPKLSTNANNISKRWKGWSDSWDDKIGYAWLSRHRRSGKYIMDEKLKSKQLAIQPTQNTCRKYDGQTVRKAYILASILIIRLSLIIIKTCRFAITNHNWTDDLNFGQMF